MALSSAATLGSMALVVAAGVGFAATGPAADDAAPASPTVSVDHHRDATPTDQPAEPVRTLAAPEIGKQPPPAVPDVYVEVYNNNGVSGPAEHATTVLDAAGWTVLGPDSWHGDIPDNTVYYPPKLEKQARRLAKKLGISRLHTAVSPMKFDRLTVIYTH